MVGGSSTDLALHACVLCVDISKRYAFVTDVMDTDQLSGWFAGILRAGLRGLMALIV